MQMNFDRQSLMGMTGKPRMVPFPSWQIALRTTRFGPSWARSVTLALCTLVVAGCVSPIALHRAVLAYDRTVSRVETELLLLNIARQRHFHPIHFTAISSIAATFDFQVSAGFGAVLADNPGTGSSATLTLGGSARESPTVTIIPIQGEEFTQRILNPTHASKVAFLARQGFDLAIIVRLMARGIGLTGYGEEGFLLNEPSKDAEYREFRRRVLHLSSLRAQRTLWIRRVAHTEGTSPKARPIVLTNYDPIIAEPARQKALHEQAALLPQNAILVDVRPGDPGGDYPLHGYIELRSFNHILYFVGQGISAEPEFDAEKDPRTGPVDANPPRTLYIRETEERPDDAVFVVEESGFWYSLEPAPEGNPRFTEWNRKAFDILYKLFQMTVTDVSQVRSPLITISK